MLASDAGRTGKCCRRSGSRQYNTRVGWPTCCENDIMENIGSAPSKCTAHAWPKYPGENPLTGAFPLPQPAISDDFQSLPPWDPRKFVSTSMTFSTRTQTSRITSLDPNTGPFDHPFVLLLNSRCRRRLARQIRRHHRLPGSCWSTTATFISDHDPRTETLGALQNAVLVVLPMSRSGFSPGA